MMRIIAYLLNFFKSWVQLSLRYMGGSDYLAATFAMSTMGVARDAAARVYQAAVAWVLRRLWVTIRLDEKDAELVLAWLREREEVRSLSQLFLYSRPTSEAQVRLYEYEPEIQVTTRLRVAFKGLRSQWIWITRDRDFGERRKLGAHVSMFGSDTRVLEAILESGREIQRRKREKYLTVVQVYDYGKEHGLNWLHPEDKDKKQPGRSISSVVLPRLPGSDLDMAEALLEDAREFLASERWYTERGIPYRRGYMLHGIPGGGKSSLVMAVASELRLPIYMLQLSSELMSDETLNTLLQYGMHDPPTILLLEDVDLLHSAVLQREKQGSDAERLQELERQNAARLNGQDQQERKRRGGKLTLSGLLNALDGPTATTGRLLFMTTNARDRLDPALFRSGRIDYEVEFTYAEHDQVRRLFSRFYSSNFTTRGGKAAASAPLALGTGGGSSSSACPPPALASASAAKTESIISATAKHLKCSATRSSSRKEGDGGAGAAEQGNLVTDLEVGGGHAREDVVNTDALAVEFADAIAQAGIRLTTADIQRHLMKFKRDPKKAVQDLPSLLRRGSISTPQEQNGGTHEVPAGKAETPIKSSDVPDADAENASAAGTEASAKVEAAPQKIETPRSAAGTEASAKVEAAPQKIETPRSAAGTEASAKVEAAPQKIETPRSAAGAEASAKTEAASVVFSPE
eukprot:TRINITY_DN10747_c0_g1_i1.p1 TRINITY_DN10747_c0_g1~~TRINITY_DN10747_c0_g1_i1.p1  ORF type:complete len:689 (-),score=177.97 TRINITY_DN10747_c0_g1_i1:334-2400(-)